MKWQWKVRGTNPKTGRSKTLRLSAHTREYALQEAERRGVQNPVSAERVFEGPTSDEQLAYARSLGIDVGPDWSAQQISNAITEKTGYRAGSTLFHALRRLGIEDRLPTDAFPCEALLDGVIEEYLGFNPAEREREVAFWIAASVACWRLDKPFRASEDLPVPEHELEAAVDRALKDEKFQRSVKRLQEHHPNHSLFCVRKIGGKVYSRQAYAVTKLQDELGLALPPRAKAHTDAKIRRNRNGGKRNQGEKTAGTSWAEIGVLAAVLFAVMWWLLK